MPETPQQYTQRMLAHSQGKDPLRLQQGTPRKLAALIKRLNKKQLAKRPAPAKWSIAEILAHLADAELVIGYRIRLILASNGTAIQAYCDLLEVRWLLSEQAGHDVGTNRALAALARDVIPTDAAAKMAIAEVPTAPFAVLSIDDDR